MIALAGGVVDSYRNLTYKSIFGKYWVHTFCPQADIVLKVLYNCTMEKPRLSARTV